MKKHLWLLLLFMTILSAGCLKENGYTPNRTVYFTVKRADWETVNTRDWSAAIDLPELDSRYITRGAILVYRQYSERDIEQWPVVYQGISYSYSASTGQIVFDVSHADGQTLLTRPEEMTFKLVLINVD